MMLAGVLPLPVAKEVRALLPVWLGGVVSLLCLAFVSSDTVFGTGRIDALMVLICTGTSAALGALSVGHEYSARTLALLLSQPASRARIFRVKQAVLALMLLTVAGIVSATMSATSKVAPVVTLSVLGGLFLAPWLTMLSRNPLAGTVFTMVSPGLLWLLVNEFVPSPWNFVVFWSALVGLSMVAAVMGWRAFMRLEAIEGRAADMRWPAAAAAHAPARRRHPIWLLVKKELGLQQLAVAVAGVYVLGWALTLVLGRTDLRYDDLFGAMTFVNSGLLALLIGSLASAEERHLSTAQWQLLLPMASWKQWIVKAGTALGLAMLLAVALPGLLMFLSAGHVAVGGGYACVVLLLTAVSLYVSSVSSSGVSALCLSAPVSVFVVFPAIAFLSRLGYIELTLPGMGLFAAALGLVLYFALVNHRTADRGAWRICVQVFCIAGCFAFCAVLVALLSTSHVQR
jgi:hypothetical protein